MLTIDIFRLFSRMDNKMVGINYLNPIQDGPFQGCSRMVGGGAEGGGG